MASKKQTFYTTVYKSPKFTMIREKKLLAHTNKKKKKSERKKKLADIYLYKHVNAKNYD